MANKKNKKSRKISWKRVVLGLTWGVAGLFFIVLLLSTVNKHNRSYLEGLKVEVVDDQVEGFISQAEIKALVLKSYCTDEMNLAVKEISLGDLENDLINHPYLAAADAHMELSGALVVEVEREVPIARIVNNLNQQYYISKNATKMPISNEFAVRVPIFTGSIKDNGKTSGPIESEIGMEIFTLSNQLYEDDFMNALIEQVYLDDKHDYVMVPKIGEQLIRLGAVEDLSKKFDHLKAFYEEGMSRVGWNTYNEINLKFSNQVVCSRDK